ncbi:TatD family hydrolase [Shewanella sp. SR44-3]|uniref:TatD family hydrolase n=1 Tax=unclassified Shewanella TaxID=196818 RepID=UPI0015F98227|nr:TatD family hydrolase [Shewanella sp. SR44-3]MBB1270174.1 TatD family hydrolase [Shewanella sp. SR44-3]
MIDSHAHLDFDDFDLDRAQLFTAMAQQGISSAILPGVSAAHWSKQLEVAAEFDCYYALGIHPWFCPENIDTELEALAQLIELQRSDNKLVALGECGLDKRHNVSDFSTQLSLLERQLQLAIHYQLPVILHSVRAHNELLGLLKRYPNVKGGVLHGFYGGSELAKAYLALGYKLGIGGLIMDPKAKKLRETVSQLSIESFIVETDSPDMSPITSQNRRNSPLNLPSFVAEIAFLKNKSTVSILEQLDANVSQLFEL